MSWFLILALLQGGDVAASDDGVAGRELAADGHLSRVVSRRHDLTGDGVADTVALGSRANETTLSIADGSWPADAERWTFVFPHDASENGLCGAPRDVRVRFEKPVLPLEEWGCTSGAASDDCVIAREQQRWLTRVAKKGTRGLRIESLECDAVHVYFDGRTFGMWRR